MTGHLHVYSEVYEGFKISLSMQDDTASVDWDAAPLGQTPQLAHVCASRHGVQLADAYLGGCYYEKPTDILYTGYYEDMRKEVVASAHEMLRKLAVPEEA